MYPTSPPPGATEHATNSGGLETEQETITNSLRGGNPLVIHLNGYAPTLKKTELRHEFKLTETSYATTSIVETPGAAFLRQDVRMADTVIFVGYSMYDIDIRRLLTENPTTVQKTFFYIGQTPTADCRRRVARYGTPIEKTAADLAGLLLQRKTNHVPSVGAARLRLIDEYVQTAAPSAITDSHVFQLLLWGQYDTARVASSMVGGVPYYQERQEIKKIIEAIRAGKRVVTIHSRLGNGKTMLAEGLNVRLREEGYRVLHPRANEFDTDKEIDLVARSGKRIAIFFETYSGGRKGSEGKRPTAVSPHSGFGFRISHSVVMVGRRTQARRRRRARRPSPLKPRRPMLAGSGTTPTLSWPGFDPTS